MWRRRLLRFCADMEIALSPSPLIPNSGSLDCRVLGLLSLPLPGAGNPPDCRLDEGFSAAVLNGQYLPFTTCIEGAVSAWLPQHINNSLEIVLRDSPNTPDVVVVDDLLKNIYTCFDSRWL